MKFVANTGEIGTIYGNQQLARDFYFTMLDSAAWGATTKEVGCKCQQKGERERIPLEMPMAHALDRCPEPVGAHYDIELPK